MADLQSRIAALSPEQRAVMESRVADLVAARGPSGTERITPRDRSRPTPLGIAQQREWAIERLRAANNIAGAFRVEGELDLDLLSAVLTEVVRRHEVLRSTVEMRADGIPVQVVHPVSPVPIPVVDLSDLAADQQREEVLRRCRAGIVRPFDPKDPSRLRLTLMRVGPTAHVALFTTDHAASDAWSVAILVQELAALYAVHRNGAPDLPPPEIQFGDFAAWQRERFDEERLTAELRHWKQTLDGIPAGLALPTDRPYPARPTYAGDLHIVDLPPELAAGIRRFSERENASLFAVMLAACSLLMHRYLDQDDLVIGSLVSGRTRVETERLLGCFANPLPLRMRVTDDQTLGELVRQARDSMSTALDHQDLPFDRLIEELGLGRESAQTSLSRLWINVLTVPDSTLELPGLRITPEPIDIGLASVDLTLSAVPHAGTLQLQWQYMTELFDLESVILLAEQFQAVLHRLVTAPDSTVGDVELTAPAAAVRPAAVETGFVELFQRRAALAPYAPAVVCDGTVTTYAELNRDANRLAHHLRGRGVGRETPVGILVDRSPALAVAILGVLKAGGVYVPLDPSYPPDRLAFMLGDANAQILITQQQPAARLADAGTPLPAETVLLDGPSAFAGGADTDRNLPDVPDPASLAYVVYTSGSTGRPKGAMIEHRSLVTYARDIVERLGLGTGDRFLQFASPGFDVLVEELFPTWLAGGAVVITTQHLISGGGDLWELVERERLTVMELPTAYWHEWVRELRRLGRNLASSLRLVIIGGERVLPERLAMWQHLNVPLMNCYGLTETTVTSTFFRLDPADPVHDWPNLPIGVPIPSADLRILDSRMRPAPTGGTGELYIGGISLARGYLGRSALTAQRFVADPDPAHPGARLYRTGDVVRRRPDGNFEFISRVDTQIKIRGFRVEPMEIESMLSRHPGLAESFVILHEPAPGDRRLVAYVVPSNGSAPGVTELRRFLERELPPYMVPSTFVELGSLPLSPNGKIDRDRLPAPDGDRPELVEDYVGPETPTQQTLVDIVASVVGVAKVGIHDNFFDLGGDSIQAIQVVARAQEEGIGLSPLDFFEHPTVALLGQAATNPNTERVVSPRPADAAPVLSFDQERLWLENQLRPRTSYHVGGRRRLIGPLDLGVLEASLRTILVRHEVLRTRFPTVDGRPIQVVDALPADWRLDVVDLSDVDGARSDDDRQEQAKLLMDEQFTTPFDLAEGPLIRCLVVKMRDDEHLLSVTAHHIVSDVWSVGLFARELGALYQAGGEFERSGLPVLPIQYRDYSVWQRGWMVGEALQTHVEHWRRHLAGAPPALALPTGERTPGAGGDRVVNGLSAEETAALQGLCRKHGVTLFMMVLACLGTVLTRWSGQQDVVIGASMSDRTDTGTEKLIGFFINTLPLRVDVSGDPTFAELLKRVRQLALDGYAHAEAPIDVLVKELHVTRDPRRTPLFQVILNVVELAPVDQIGDFVLEAMDTPQLLSSFDHVVTAQEVSGELFLRLEFNAERYQQPMMQALIDGLATFMREVVSDAGQDIRAYPLHAAIDGTSTWQDAVARPAPHLAVDWFAQLPDRVAVADQDGEWSYQWLNRATEVMATHVRHAGELGVVRRSTAAFIAAVLGCVKAGVDYTVIEPDSSVPGISTVLDVADGAVDLSAAGPPAHRTESGAPALDWAVERHGLGGDDRFAVPSGRPELLMSALCTAFGAGATLVLPPPSLVRDIGALTRWLQSNRISVVYLNPPLLRTLSSRRPRPELPALTHVFVDNAGGLIAHDVDALRRLAPQCRLVGLYRVARDGRPLATYAVPADWDLSTAPMRVPLGIELPGHPAELRHPGGEPASTGEVAEICVDGHRTGDLARRWTDGTLEFVRRAGEDAHPRKELAAR